MRAWRNGRRARLRGVFLTRVWVQVPPLAPKDLSQDKFFYLVYYCLHPHSTRVSSTRSPACEFGSAASPETSPTARTKRKLSGFIPLFLLHITLEKCIQIKKAKITWSFHLFFSIYNLKRFFLIFFLGYHALI